MARRLKVSDEDIRSKFALGLSDTEIAAAFDGVSPDYIRIRRIGLRLLRRKGKPAGSASTMSSRFSSHTVLGKPRSIPAMGHPAFSQARTIFPHSVVGVEGLDNVLISGFNSRKIGARIEKGPAKGFPIYTLTLEERATCPTSCRHWASCFGNNMHMAKRIRHDAAFEERLEAELLVLQSRNPAGFAVRLHVLGDFYSVEYVKLWEKFLGRFKSLMVFGFSARWQEGDPIADALVDLVERQWGRFSIRFSNAPFDECSTISIEHPIQAPADSIICPAQIGKTDNCGTCGLCWHSRRRIAFLQH